MKRQQTQYDSDLLQMQQQIDLMKSMGLMQDPTQQAMGLVQLMNATQAPEIQQEQFGREMGFKELMGQQEQDYRNRTLDQQAKHQGWQQQTGNRELDMRGQALGLDREKLGQDQRQYEGMMNVRKMSEVMDFLKMLAGGAMQQQSGIPSRMNFNAAGQMGEQFIPGFSGLFGQQANPNGPPPEWEKFGDSDISNESMWRAMQGLQR